MTHRIIASVVSSLLALSLCSPLLFAQRREELVFADVPIVFSAARHSQPINEAPSTVDVISREDIKSFNLKTLADALRLVSGIDAFDMVSFQKFSVRGLNSSTSNNTVLCLMDGCPLNNSLEGAFDPTTIPLENVERIEIIKGPGSAMYGSNALGGVINIITTSANLYDRNRISLGGGTQNAFQQEILVSRRSENTGVVVTGWGATTDSAADNKITPNDGRREFDAFAKIQNDHLTFTYSHYQQYMLDPGTLTLPSTDAEMIFDRDFVSFDYTAALSPRISMLMRTYFTMTNQNIIEGGNSGIAGEDRRLGAEIQSNFQLSSRNLLITGCDWHNDAGFSEYLDLPERETLTNSAFYVQDELQLTNRFIVTLGGRYDDASVLGSRLSPRASVIFKYSPATTYKLFYGQAFRAPSFFELFHNFSVPGYMNTGNRELKPEILTTTEAGIFHSFTRSLSGSVNLFSTDVRDRISFTEKNVTIDSIDYLVIQNNNVTRTTITGGEAGLSYQSYRFTSKLTYSYQEAFDDTGIEPLYAPRHKANLRLSYRILAPLSINTLTYFIDESKDTYDRITRQNLISDAHVVWNVTKDLELKFSVVNIFDAPNGIFERQPIWGRNFLLEAGYQF